MMIEKRLRNAKLNLGVCVPPVLLLGRAEAAPRRRLLPRPGGQEPQDLDSVGPLELQVGDEGACGDHSGRIAKAAEPAHEQRGAD